MTKPLVAIVGRPNVGKSTFFNRMGGAPMAIVEDLPGTTRDRLYTDANWNGRDFTLVDTGGLVLEHDTGVESRAEIAERVREQISIALQEASVIVFMVDATTGITPTDLEVADMLRRAKKPVVVAANKADNEKRRLDAVEFYQLGLGDPIPISSLHGTNTGDLLDEIVKQLPPAEVAEEEEAAVKAAIVGRPNVGKSSLLNSLLGEERAIVSDIPGTTRDAIDTVVEWSGQRVVLIDTGGIRRRGKIERGIEKYSALRAERAIGRSDVALLLVDAVEGVTAQDTHIAGYVLEESKGLIILGNKWDLIEHNKEMVDEFHKHVRQELNFVPWAPLHLISAKCQEGLKQIPSLVLRVAEERRKRISTGLLNRLVQEALENHNPPTKPGKYLKFYYATQAGVAPPTFVFFVNDATLIHFSYERYMENRIRHVFGFEGTPIKMIFRSREEEK